MSNEMISFSRELSDELAEFIAEKARVCGGGAYDIWEALCERFGQPAAQHQGEPVDALLLDDCVEHKHPGYGVGYFGTEVVKLYTRPAEQPEPVSSTSDKYKAELYDEVWQLARDMGFGNVTDALMKLKKQPAPVAVVPDGYCIMPRHLTAENGAKALLLGEFKLQSSHECPECRELEEPSEGCEICDGEGEYGQNHVLPWDLIKFIYSKAVKGLAVKAEPAKF